MRLLVVVILLYSCTNAQVNPSPSVASDTIYGKNNVTIKNTLAKIDTPMIKEISIATIPDSILKTEYRFLVSGKPMDSINFINSEEEDIYLNHWKISNDNSLVCDVYFPTSAGRFYLGGISTLSDTIILKNGSHKDLKEYGRGPVYSKMSFTVQLPKTYKPTAVFFRRD
jgi:hypothetical protein